MIKVILDYGNIISNPDAWVINDNLSYLKAYAHLTNNQFTDDLIFILKRKVFKTWIDRYLNRLSENSYIVQNASLASILESRWMCSIPKDLTDDIIHDNSFLEIEDIPLPGEQFEDFILRIYFGINFSRKSITIEDIPNLLDQSNSKKYLESLSQIYLKNVLAKRLDLWKSLSDKHLNYILGKFIKSPDKLRDEIASYSVLKYYKNLATQLLPEFQAYDILNLPLSKFKLDEKNLTEIIHQIEYEINSWKDPEDTLSLKELVSNVSGRLMIEFRRIDEIIERKPHFIDKELIDLLVAKFQYLLDVKDRIELLNNNIPPSFPITPDQDWPTPKMIDWAINEYFPYFKWALTSSRKLHDLEPLSVAFSDWYFRNYEKIKYNSGKMLFNFIPNNFENFVNEQQTDIVLIIDNLPWFFLEILKETFTNNSFYLGSCTAYLAHIPTLTEYSKKCLVSGIPDYLDITDPSYKKILEEGGWILYKDQLKLKYYPTVGAFYKEKALEGGTHFINYLQLDELFHKTEEELGVSHIQAAKDALNTLIKSFLKHINSITNDKSIRFHIISDHGATFLDPNNVGLLPQDFIKSKGLQNYSYRYACLPGNPSEFLTPDIVLNSYQLAKDSFGLPESFLIVRGFKSFLAIKGHCMSHGGIQPEEVIIPHLVFEKSQLSLLIPTLSLKIDKYRYASQEILIEIGNPNNEDLSEVYITILNSNIDCEKSTLHLSNLKKKLKETITFTGKFKQTSNNFEKENLKFGIRYIIKSQQFIREINLPINMISMVKTDDSGIFNDF